MLDFLRPILVDVLKAVAPLVGVICVLQATLVGAPLPAFLQFLAGALLVVLGMTLLFAGVDVGLLPMGRYVGAALPGKGSLALILAVAFGIGFLTTLAEPDVLVLTEQVAAASQNAPGSRTLGYLIATGVGSFVALGVLRIVFGWSMTALLALTYSVIVVATFVAPAPFVPLAHDAGSVTTGVLTAPVVLALAAGLTSVLGRRSNVSDGFGLLGLASAGPIIVILLMAIALR